MTLYHLAYTFNSDDFHGFLRTKTVKNGKLKLLELQQLARSIVQNAPESLLGILRNIKYDEQWLDNPENDESQAYLWYTICLTSYFRECPSLSNNRLVISHIVLEKILPLLGWTTEQIRELIFGKFLDTLVNSPEDNSLLNSLSLYGGALSLGDIGAINLHLEENSKHFSAKQPSMTNAVSTLASYNNLSAAQVIDMAHSDAIDMLRACTERE